MKKVYISLTLIFIVTLVAGFLVIDDFTRYILAGASSLSFVSLFITFIIDQVKAAIGFAYDKQRLAYEASLNSNLAYDINKAYLRFCENYIAKVYEISEKLFREGSSKKAYDYSFELFDIRKSSSLYIPESVYTELEKFEYVLRVIGAESEYQECTINSEPDQELRRESIKKTYRLFLQLMDLNNKDQDRKIKNREEIIRYIRETVGINRMIQLKNDVLKINSNELNG